MKLIIVLLALVFGQEKSASKTLTFTPTDDPGITTTLTYVTEMVDGKPTLKGDMFLKATYAYFGGKKIAGQEFRFTMEWSKGALSADTHREAVASVFLNFGAGYWIRTLNDAHVVKCASKASLDAHGDDTAHLYYASKPRTWDGWTDCSYFKLDPSTDKTGVDADAQTFKASFSIVLSDVATLQQGETYNLGLAWGQIWDDQTTTAGLKGQQAGKGEIAHASWPIAWIPSEKAKADAAAAKLATSSAGLPQNALIIIIACGAVVAIILLAVIMICCGCCCNDGVQVIDGEAGDKVTAFKGESVAVELVHAGEAGYPDDDTK